jgi:hypothetical protein
MRFFKIRIELNYSNFDLEGVALNEREGSNPSDRITWKVSRKRGFFCDYFQLNIVGVGIITITSIEPNKKISNPVLFDIFRQTDHLQKLYDEIIYKVDLKVTSKGISVCLMLDLIWLIKGGSLQTLIRQKSRFL